MRLLAVIAFALAAIAAPAQAQGAGEGSGNPLAVTWTPRLSDAFAPVALAARDEPAAAQMRRIAFRLPDSAIHPAPTAAPYAWGPTDAANRHFLSCETDAAGCGDPPANLGLSVRNDSSGLQLGALVRLGESLTKESDGDDPSWRFFAAADAHALTWSFDRRRDGDDVRVETKQLVGDAQVGVARTVAGGDLALGFVHREVSWKGVSRDEQFGGVTFVLIR